MSQFSFVKAVKRKEKLRMAIDGPSGAGKTWTSLTLGQVLAADAGGRIAVIDSERGSARKYASDFDFDHLELPDSSPHTYIDAVRAAGEAGYAVVTAPGPDVLRVSTAVVNLFLNAPDTMSPGRSRTFTANAGEATLVIEVRDSPTNALLGRVVDRRETLDSGGMQMATSVSNLSDFRMLFKQWATTSAKGLDELKAHSPVPLDLKPKQRL